MSTKRTPIPVIDYVQRLSDDSVRIFFNDGLVLEVKLPVRGRPKRIARIDDWGTGLRFGSRPDDEMSAYALYVMRGRVLRRGTSEALRTSRRARVS